MNKRIGLFLLLAGIFSICNNARGQEAYNKQIAMQFVKLVQKRYYFIHRLGKPIQVLFDLFNKLHPHQAGLLNSILHHSVNKNMIIEPGTALLFRHDAVRRCVKKIEQTQTIDAVQELWADFMAYKYIESNQYVQETLKAIMLLYKSLLINITQLKSDVLSDDSIDYLLEDKNNEINDNFHMILNMINSDEQEKDFLINNNLRMYLIRRLHKPIHILSKIKPKHITEFWNCLYKARAENAINFKHQAIASCVDNIINAKSLNPLFVLWYKFSSYLFIDDSLFLKEFVSLQYMVYARLIECLKKDKAPTVVEIVELYDSVAALPMPEMLNSLDILVEQLILILEKYEVNAAIPWTAWFKKYWWVPPVIGASLYFNFYNKNAVVQPTV